MKMTKLMAAATILAFVAGACSSSSTPESDPADATPTTGETATVEVHDDMFTEDALTVAPNTTVTWNWVDTSNPHNVVADGGAFDSGDLLTEGSFSFTFTEVGVYSYFCEAHKATGMVGTITVA